MTDSVERRAPSYFAYEAEARAFQSALLRALGERQRAIVGKYLPPENTQHFRHGGGWRNPNDPNDATVHWQTHSAVIEIPFDDIIGNDLLAIARTFAKTSEAMERQFAQMLYSTVSEAADRVGNTVDAQAEGSLADAFKAAIEKIEFFADKNGKVVLPEIHVSPETGARMMAELEAAPQTFLDGMEALKERKTEEALAREAKRKAKFVRYGSLQCES